MSIETISKYGLLVGSAVTIGKWTIEFAVVEVSSVLGYGLPAQLEDADTGGESFGRMEASSIAWETSVEADAFEDMTLEQVQAWSQARNARLAATSDSVQRLRVEVQKFHDLIEAEKTEGTARKVASHRRR